MKNIKQFSINDFIEKFDKLKFSSEVIEGVEWFITNDLSSISNSKIGDVCLDISDNSLYKKDSLGWNLITTIEKMTNTNFSIGQGIPLSSFGNINDIYLRTLNSKFYKKTESNRWIIVGTCRGDDGDSYSLDLGELQLNGSIYTTNNDILNKDLVFNFGSVNPIATTSLLIKGNDGTLLITNPLGIKLLRGYQYIGRSTDKVLIITDSDFVADKDFEDLSITNFNTRYGSVAKHVLNTIALNGGNSGCSDTITPNGEYPGSVAFIGGVLLPDGRVFLVPANSTTARIYDPITDTLSTPSGTYPGSGAFHGGVLLLDGRVFVIPSNSTTARIYDPISDTLVTPTGIYSGNSAYKGGISLPDGKVFYIPYNSTSARIYDPIADTLSTPSGTYPGSSAFGGAVLLPDGRVFCIPRNSISARIYDPVTDTLITPSGTYPGTVAFIGGVLLPDGRVFLVPFSSTSARIYDPIADTLITPSGTYPGFNSFAGGILLSDGRVFMIPASSTTARITTPEPAYKFNLPTLLGPTYNKF